MAKKTYKTFYLKSMQILLQQEERIIEVVFRGGIQIDSTARFSTSDEWIQNKLESMSAFNRDYYLESVQEEKEKPAENVVETPAVEKEETEKPLTDVKDIKHFRNLVEMKSHMAELGFKDVQSMNYAQCKAAAAKEGYDFQIKK